MPSGKWNWRAEDTTLYFAELLVSRMRGCLERKETTRLHGCSTSDHDGAATDQHRFVVVPKATWKRLRPGVLALAKTAGLEVTYPATYWVPRDNIVVRFHRLGGDAPTS